MLISLLTFKRVIRRLGDGVTIPELMLWTPRESLKITQKAGFQPTKRYLPILALAPSDNVFAMVF
jgi:hypothetical protein